MSVRVGVRLQALLTAEGTVGKNILLLDIRALLNPLSHIARPLYIHT